jgi:hypothetical protein
MPLQWFISPAVSLPQPPLPPLTLLLPPLLLLSMTTVQRVDAQGAAPGPVNGERGGYGAFCSLEERGCYQDCYDPTSQKFVSPPTTQTYRTLPFGVAGCCSDQQDPPGGCKAGSCATQTCVNEATPNVHSFCPTAAATCQPCAPAQLDHDVCAAHCFDLGYSFSGVEYANQCTCGDHIPAWSKPDSTDMLCRSACGGCEGGAHGDRTKECDACKCPANKEQWCGGGCAITIREVVCSWGMPFLLVFVFGALGYVVIGTYTTWCCIYLLVRHRVSSPFVRFHAAAAPCSQ